MRIAGIIILIIALSSSAYAQNVRRERMESRGDQIQRKDNKPERGNGLVGKKSPADAGRRDDRDRRQGQVNRKKRR